MELLFEIRCQQMPEGSLLTVLKQLAGRLFEELMGHGLAPQEILTGATARRLTLCCQGLPETAPDRQEQELGPPLTEAYRDGEATQALHGFIERVGVDAAELQEIKTERGTYLGVVRHVAGRSAEQVLRQVLPRVLAEMRWPSRAAWHDERRWPRPLTGLLAMLDGELLACDFDGFEAGRETVGHPHLSPLAFVVSNYADYREGLSRRGIEISWQERRAKLKRALSERAMELGGELVADDDLLGLLTDRCEIPGIVHGSFDVRYLELPREVLLATLMDHQRAFAVALRQELLPFFITVMDRLDDVDGVVQRGHERALAGRLLDAGFYYQADREVSLVERSTRLDQMTFHPGLSTLGDKTRRVAALVEIIAAELDWQDDLAAAQQAAALAKADLTTDMVREYPSLRGTMGGIYAREEGYIGAVWQAVAEHYRPASRRGPVPTGRAASLLAVADRVDTVVGFCGLGQLPKGSSDPLALRRLVQGLLRILVEHDMELDVDLVAARSVLLYGDVLPAGAETVVSALQSFFDDRVRHFLGQQGMAIDEIEATMAVGGKTLPNLVARLRALHEVRGMEDFHALVLAAKRISSIVQGAPEHGVRDELLVEEAELALAQELAEVRQAVTEAVAEQRYKDGLMTMQRLVTPLDRFFAEVLVMDENESLRQNRLALLQRCRRVFWRIARLHEMAVERGHD